MGNGNRTIGLFPCAFLLLIVVVYTLSECTDRHVLIEGSVLTLLLLPLVWWFFVCSVRICDGFIGVWLMCAVTLLLYLAGVQAFLPGALPSGWWRFAPQCAAFASCLFVVASRVDARDRIRHLGAAGSCALLVCVAMNAYLGLLQPLSTVSFGFGHINILANTAGPSLIAWLVLCGHDWRKGRVPRISEILLLGAGLLCLIAIVVTTHRRGLQLGLAMAGGWLALSWLWYRSKKAAVTVGVIGAFAAIAMAGHLLSNDMPTLRNERVRIYRSAFEGAVAGLPWGFGRYGALHLQHVDAPACRHMTADGGYGTHVHNEFLDVCLDGGPIALALLLGLVAMLGYRLVRIREPAVRRAYQAMAAAILAHLLTDNVYGTEVGVVWLGIVAGMMLTAPTTGVAWRPITGFPSMRLLIGVCAVISAWGAYREVPIAFLPRLCDAQAQMRCALSALDPQSLELHAEAALLANPPLNAAEQKRVIDDQQRKMGWTIRLIGYDTIYNRSVGTPEQVTQDCVRVLQMNPFGKYYYTLLAQTLRQHASCARKVPGAVLRRIAYLSGQAGLPAPNLAAPLGSIDDGADAYAGIIWAIANDRPWSQIEGPLATLCRAYGDIQDVAELVVQAATAAAPTDFPWMRSVYGILEYGLRNPAAMLETMALAKTPAQARVILPLFEYTDPAMVAACAAAHAGTDNVEFRSGITRIYALGHAAEPPK